MRPSHPSTKVPHPGLPPYSDLGKRLGVGLPLLLGSWGPGESAWGQKAGFSPRGELCPTCSTCHGARGEGRYLSRLRRPLLQGGRGPTCFAGGLLTYDPSGQVSYRDLPPRRQAPWDSGPGSILVQLRRVT